MRVLLTLAGTDEGRSGIGTYIWQTVPRIARRLAERGDRLVVVGSSLELEVYRSALGDCETVALGAVYAAPAASAAWHAFSLGAFAREQRADVILLPAANRRVAWLSTIPTVSVVHDLAPLIVRKKYDALRQAYVAQLVVRALRRSSELVAVSQATRKDVARFVGRADARIRVVHNGVDADRFRPMADGRREDPYILYASRLEHPGKNHVGLLRGFAASAVRATHRLLLAGEDWGGRALLEAEAASLGLGERVRFLGRVPDDDFPALVAGAEAVAMVGLHEGFGLPALEALASGVPVVAADAGALPEVVGALGVLCDPHDPRSIAEALARAVDDEHRARARAEGPSWAARFGWEVTASGLIDACVAARRAA